MNKVFVSFSGGADSTVLLAHYINHGFVVIPVFFNYGSKHNPYERAAADDICKYYGLSGPVIDLTSVFQQNDSALMAKNDREIPSGEAGYQEPGSLDATVVPGRNHIFASVLSAYAEAEALRSGPVSVAMAMHASDHALYPDCRPQFASFLDLTIDQGTEGRVRFRTPFVHLSKGDIVKRGITLEVPFSLTRSCYKAQGIACGVCGTCRERLKAFEEAGASDPIEYAKN